MRNKIFEVSFTYPKPKRLDAIKYWQARRRLGELLAPIYAYRKETQQNVAIDTLLSQVRNAKDKMRQALTTTPSITIKRSDKGFLFSDTKFLYENKRRNNIRECFDSLKYQVKESRESSRYMREERNIHKTPGYWFNEQLKRAFRDKKPKDSKQYIGIEIECLIPCGSRLEMVLADYSKYVSLAGDGSIEDTVGYEGKEIRILVDAGSINNVVNGVVAKLHEAGAKINKSCGLHVHFDMRDTTEEKRMLVYKNLYHSLGLLYTIVPESRRKNRYCQKNNNSDYHKQGGDRYKAINVTSYHRHSTFEIRLFGGTIEAIKILNWIELLESVINGKLVNRCPKDFDTAQKYFGYSDEIKEWAKSRQIKFGTTGEVTNEAMSEIENTVTGGNVVIVA